ncbi:tetratricopeptide repeat protein 6 [Erethizon dorsatum]
MSKIPKHFGLNTREESYMFKELEKVRQETKRDFLQFKQKWACRPVLEESSDYSLQALGLVSPREKRRGFTAPRGLAGSPQTEGPATAAAARLQGALRGVARPPAATWRSRSFCPRDFYLRSSAFLRHRSQKKPPAITSQAGTSRPVVLLPPSKSLGKPRERSGPGSPRPGARALDGARGWRASQGAAMVPEGHKAKDRKVVFVSSEDSDAEAGGWRRAKIRPGFAPAGSGGALQPWAGTASRAARESGAHSDVREAARQGVLRTRAVPRSIREIIASLQSEAQLASDQTIRELIESVLGQNYDIRMEDISLMGKIYVKIPQVQAETPKTEAEQVPQMNIEESNMVKSLIKNLLAYIKSMTGELPDDVSSIFQIEKEVISEWPSLDAEDIAFKFQESLEMHPIEEPTKRMEDGQLKSDSKVPKRISTQVQSSEFLQIRGKEVKRTRRSKSETPPLRQEKSLKPQVDQKLLKKIPQAHCTPGLHHLCTTTPARQLPIDLHLASRIYHTTDKKGHNAPLGVFGPSFQGSHFADTQRDRILYGIPVMDENQESVSVPPVPSRLSPEIARRTRWRFHNPHLELLGQEMSAYPGFTKMFWNPAAPKFAVPESVMKETVYPQYESAQASRILTKKFLADSKESVALYDHSTFQCSPSCCGTFGQGKTKVAPRPVYSWLLPDLAQLPLFHNTDSSYTLVVGTLAVEQPVTVLLLEFTRAKSAVELRKEGAITPIEIKDDMQSNIKTMMFQKAKELEHQFAKQNETKVPLTSVKENIGDNLNTVQKEHTSKILSVSLIEASKQAGITYIVYPRGKKVKEKKGLKFKKLAIVCEELSKPPNMIKRSASHGILPGQKKYFLRVPLYERLTRSPSLPMSLNFDKFVQRKGAMLENSDPYLWVRDTLFKDQLQKTVTKAVEITVKRDLPESTEEPPEVQLSDSLECDLPPEAIKHYESQVGVLTEEINEKKTFLAFAYCRRGAIYRKLGKLQSAMNDLQEAILLEPLFLNAYWHRHFIYLFQDKINEALNDLNFINKYNKNNADVYLSKAEIYRKSNNITLTILNYSQAIKCRPTDADIYFRRGEVYEIENRVLAIDDFSKCIFYDPKRTDALLKRGKFYSQNENWISAIQDFTTLLNIEQQNSEAWTYRGKAYFKRHLYKQATQDFSIAIHLDPNNWIALYYRACIFRKSNPLRALQDNSVSALINDGYENLSCFLHRGILYAHLKFWLLAICDFETVLSLERTCTLAYVNIGLIQMLHLDNYTEAIWHFSEAIRVDPLCIQNYMCRAEAYYKLHKWKRAAKELSRAIHLQPDGIQLYIIRGQYLLMMKCYDLAKFTIYQIAEMNTGLIGLSPIQQAHIYSFCENYDKAIQILDGMSWDKSDMTMFMLLAKAQMKAKKIKEAVRMFKKALEVFSHSDKGPNAVAISADCLHNLGLCYLEEGNLQMAFDYFTKAVTANPEFAEGFYQRGLCKVKLQKDNSILDFNRAIALNPEHFQAYLSRVALYGLKGRYSKAILNCNEAIKIYPQSVRAYLYRGVLKYYSKNYKLAIRDLTIAVNMDKNSYIAFYNRALCYTKIRELKMALIDFGIVLLLDARETITLNTFINRGLIYNELEQYSFALEDFKQAASISQTNVSLCQATAMCHHRIQEFKEAIDFFTQALKIDPLFLDAYIGRGNSYMEYEHEEAVKQAQKDFLKALRLNPLCTKARISLCYNLQAQGKLQKAWNHFTIAMEVDPRSYLAYEGRAVVCLQMGINFAAMQDINAAIKINTTAEFLTNRGVINEFMGQRQNAMKDYQAAIALDPKYSLAYFNAGNIYFHHRQFSQASDYYSKSLKFDPENEYVLMNRAITNTILNKYEEAKEDFACVIDRCPFWAAVYFNRAHLYCCLKQYDLAEEDLSRALSLKPNDVLVYNLRAEVRGKIGLTEEAMADYNQALDLEEYASVT